MLFEKVISAIFSSVADSAVHINAFICIGLKVNP